MAGQFHSTKIVGEALTFDDVLLVPRRATIHPREIDVSTQLTRKSASTSAGQRPDGHRHREHPGHRPRPGRRHPASSTAT